MNFPDTPACFTSDGGIIDTAPFVNNISQGDAGNFADNSSDLASTNILPRLLDVPIVVAASPVSFSDDVVGNIVDNVFSGVPDINLRDRGKIKIPSHFQSSPCKPNSINSSVLVRLLCIK